MNRLPDKGLQAGDHQASHIHQVPEPFLRRDIPIYPTVFKRYEDGALNLHVHFGISQRGRFRPTEMRDFCVAVAKFSPGLLAHDSTSGKDTHGCVDEPACRDNEISMFVGVVECAEESKPMERRIGSRPVGLVALDDCASLPGHSLACGSEIDYRFLVQLSDDREESTTAPLPWDKCNRDVIKSRPCVVQHVAGDDGEVRIRLLELDTIDPSVAFRLRLDRTNRLVRVSINVLPDFAVELQQVLFRPVEFELPRLCHWPPSMWPAYGTP